MLRAKGDKKGEAMRKNGWRRSKENWPTWSMKQTTSNCVLIKNKHPCCTFSLSFGNAETGSCDVLCDVLFVSESVETLEWKDNTMSAHQTKANLFSSHRRLLWGLFALSFFIFCASEATDMNEQVWLISEKKSSLRWSGNRSLWLALRRLNVSLLFTL